MPIALYTSYVLYDRSESESFVVVVAVVVRGLMRSLSVWE